jgi:hypothetical protein
VLVFSGIWLIGLCLSFLMFVLLWVKKGEVIPVHAMKAYSGSGGVAPPILNLDSRWS